VLNICSTNLIINNTNSVAPEPEGSSPCLQYPSNCPNLSQQNPLHNLQPDSSRSIMIPSSYLRLIYVFIVISFFRTSPPET
jgi:hypothetical protein